jgi:hypothetical protein
MREVLNTPLWNTEIATNKDGKFLYKKDGSVNLKRLNKRIKMSSKVVNFFTNRDPNSVVRDSEINNDR